MDSKKFAVVIGGTSGLGLEMAIALKQSGYTVFTASRRGEEEAPESDYHVEWDAVTGLSDELWPLLYEQLVREHGGASFDLIAYTVGAWSTGNFFEVNGAFQLERQARLSMHGPAEVLYHWYNEAYSVDADDGDPPVGNPVFVMVSSTSAHVIRTNADKPRESAYAAAKAGMSHLARTVVGDMAEIGAGRMLLVEPGGMASWFPEGGMDTAKVAKVVLEHAERMPEEPGGIEELIINRGEGNEPMVSLGPVQPYAR